MRVAASGHCKTDPIIMLTDTQKTKIVTFEKMVTGAVPTKLVLDPSRYSHRHSQTTSMKHARDAIWDYGTQTSTNVLAVVRRGRYDGGNPLLPGLI